jgi:hypothetical protein
MSLLLPASELELAGAPVFDQSALRPGPYDTGELAAVGGGYPAGRSSDPRFDGAYGSSAQAGHGYQETSGGRHSAPSDGGFPWFHEEQEGQGPGTADFSWFTPGPEDAEDAGYGAGSGPYGQSPPAAPPVPPAAPARPAPGRHAYPDQPAMQPMQQPMQPQLPYQQPPSQQRPSRPQAQQQSRQLPQHQSQPQELPRRVPLEQRAPDAQPRRAAPPPSTPPLGPRAAGQMRDRLSSFHQGVMRGKDGTDRDGRGRPPGGSGPL